MKKVYVNIDFLELSKTIRYGYDELGNIPCKRSDSDSNRQQRQSNLL